MALSKATSVPSGDHNGRVSGPTRLTSARIEPSSTETVEISAVLLFEGSALSRWSKAIVFPSGDQSTVPTVSLPPVNRRGVFAARSITHRWESLAIGIDDLELA